MIMSMIIYYEKCITFQKS